MENTLSKTLITGAAGMVGGYIDFGIRTTRNELDIQDLNSIDRVFRKYKPKVVIHLAAETDVDKCERDPGHAYLVNSAGTYNIALAAKQHGARIVYVSTAAVFDGKKETPYETTDEANPQHHYGRSKHIGELTVRALNDDHLIVRAGWVFGGGEQRDKKFVGKMMRLMERNRIEVVDDKFGSPTYAKDLVNAIRVLVEEDARGTYHLANLGTCSRYELAAEMRRIIGSSTEIVPVSSKRFSMDAERGASEGLRSDERLMRPWKTALAEYLSNEWKSDYATRKTCRVCDSSQLKLILDLGRTPLANSFLTKEELEQQEKTFPLRLFFCESCSLVQLIDVVDPRLLFLHYDYLTSASAPLVRHFEDMADTVAEKFHLTKKDLVVEVGSNDGALLAHIKNRTRVLGIDPAEEAAELASGKGVQTVVKFLDDSVAEDVVSAHGSARIVIANNVMAHMDNVRETFGAVRKLLEPGGHFIFEVHWVGNLVSEGGFDQIYHEHLCYYSLHALRELLRKTGFSLEDAELVPVHGQSIRVTACNGTARISSHARSLLERERAEGLNTAKAYEDFADRVRAVKSGLKKLLGDLHQKGLSVAGYGAPAKGNTLLNYCEIGPDLVEYISDSTPFKQGKYTPGSHIPIVTPDVIRTRKPRYIILLAWNYADAIIGNERELRTSGTKFILPVPKVRIV